MNIQAKRIISLILVICMMFTMTGCSGLGSVVTGLFQVVMKLLGYGVIIGVMWVVDLVTWPFVEKTGFNVNKTGDELCLKWTNLIAPDDSPEDWGGYFVIRDEEKLYRKLFQHALNHPEKMEYLLKEIDYVFGSGPKPEEEMEEEYSDGGMPKAGTNEIYLYYDAGEGAYNVPQEQIIKLDDKEKQLISEVIPVKPGYHFLGWTRTYDGITKKPDFFTEEEWAQLFVPHYFPGKKVSSKTGQEFKQDTVLYAVWVEAEKELNEENPLYELMKEHTIKVEQHKKTPLITIKCDCGTCGMTINDENISLEEFARYCNNSKKGMDEAEIDRLYNLYRMQHLGFVALHLNGMFFEKDPKKMDYEAVFSTVEEISGIMEEVTPVVEKYARKQYTGRSEKKLVEDIFEDISDTTGVVNDAAEKVCFAISLFQAASTIHDMMDGEEDLISRTVAMLDTVECVSSFLGVDAIASPVVDTLKEGMKLVEKCAENREKYYAVLEADKKAGKYPLLDDYPYLEDVLNSKYVPQGLSELVFTGTPGCTCGSSETCNFERKNNTGTMDGTYLHYLPDTFATIRAMKKSTIKPEGKESELLMLYLAERSRHDFYQTFHMTLEEYLEELKG